MLSDLKLLFTSSGFFLTDSLPRPSDPCVLWLLPLIAATRSGCPLAPPACSVTRPGAPSPGPCSPSSLGFHPAPPVSGARPPAALSICSPRAPPSQRPPRPVCALSWGGSSGRGEASCRPRRVLAHVLVLDGRFLMDRLRKACGFRLHMSRVQRRAEVTELALGVHRQWENGIEMVPWEDALRSK